MERLAVLAKILRAGHELAHLLERGHRLSVDLGPCATQTMDGCGAKGGNDRS